MKDLREVLIIACVTVSATLYGGFWQGFDLSRPPKTWEPPNPYLEKTAPPPLFFKQAPQQFDRTKLVPLPKKEVSNAPLFASKEEEEAYFKEGTIKVKNYHAGQMPSDKKESAQDALKGKPEGSASTPEINPDEVIMYLQKELGLKDSQLNINVDPFNWKK